MPHEKVVQIYQLLQFETRRLVSVDSWSNVWLSDVSYGEKEVKLTLLQTVLYFPCSF